MLETPLGPLFDLAETGESEYRLARPPVLGTRVLGSGIIAASVLATSASMAEPLRPVSLHATFVRAAVPDVPLHLTIERFHDGRSVAVRLVRVLQEDRPVAACTLRFHRAGGDGGHAPWELVPAERPISPEVGRREDAIVATMDLLDGFDIRAAVPPGSVERRVMHPYWARAVVPVPQWPGVDEALVGLLSDLGVSNNAAPPELPFSERRRVASLDHALWWHTPPRIDSWLLVNAVPVRGAAGRGIARGTISTEDGLVVASFVQEIIVPGTR